MSMEISKQNDLSLKRPEISSCGIFDSKSQKVEKSIGGQGAIQGNQSCPGYDLLSGQLPGELMSSVS